MRRQLLATALRLTDTMSPKLHTMLAGAREKLELTIPVESYVYNSPTFNAACVKPEEGTLLLMFSSALLEKFDESELLFVMGHELGHHLFAHHEIPIGYLMSGPQPVGPRLALQLFSWSRYAEISADRAGAICVGDGNAAARTLFKLASGLTTDLIEIRIDEFAAQADALDLERKPSPETQHNQDWFMTHPFTPLRVKALQLFFQSDLMSDGGLPRTQLESDTHELMGIMSPTYLQEKTPVAEAMRRVLFAAGCGLMNVSGGITEQEIEAFDQLFGEGAFGDNLDLDRLAEALDQRIAKVNEIAPHARKVHIVQDLCLIAIADGRVSPEEQTYIETIGEKLNLAPAIVAECLSCDLELD